MSQPSKTPLPDLIHTPHDLRKLDEENRAAMDAYLRNIHAMEEITRLQTNLALLE